MRIAHLPSSYLPDFIGGTETFVSTLVATLSQQGDENAVVIHTDQGPTTSDPPELFRLPPRSTQSRVGLYTHQLGSVPLGFTEFLETWRPDIVHFHSLTLGAGLDHVDALARRNIPYVVTYHTPAQSCPRGTLLRFGDNPCAGRLMPSECARCVLDAKGFSSLFANFLARSPLDPKLVDGVLANRLALPGLLHRARDQVLRFYRSAKAIIACADFCRDVLLENGIEANKISVIRQALPGPARERKLKAIATNGELRLGYFGRVTHTKGVDVAIRSLKYLREAETYGRLEIVGPADSEQQKWLRSFLDNESAAHYMGIKTGEDLSAWLRTLDLVIIPSRWLETGPLTLLEAWDEGVPVIGTNQAGIRDFMQSNGLESCLFPVDDPKSLAATIKRLASPLAASMLVKIPGSIEQCREYSRIYDSVLQCTSST